MPARNHARHRNACNDYARVHPYGSVWYDRIGTITSTSVLNRSGSRVESMTYDATSGEMLTHNISGWTGSAISPLQEQHTTVTTLYNGVEAAAFTPVGAFLSSWLTLAQPAGMRKAIDGPRTDLDDVTTFVYYPIDTTVPGTQRGRLAATMNAAGHIIRYKNYSCTPTTPREVARRSAIHPDVS